MDKNNIKNRLTQRFISEESTPGIKVTADMKKKSGAINKKGVGAEAKDAIDYNKSLKQDSDTSKMADNKFNYTDDFEKTYHDEMEIMNGQEMLQYDRKPNKLFQEKAEEGIAGSSRMGNNPEWANVVDKQQGFEGPEFGKNLVKRIKASEKKRSEETPTLNLRGANIQADTEDTGHRPYAFEKSVNEEINQTVTSGSGWDEKTRNVQQGNLTLNSYAKQLYSLFKKEGAKVKLLSTQGGIGEKSAENVFIISLNNTLTIRIANVGDPMAMANKYGPIILKQFPELMVKEKPKLEGWAGMQTATFILAPKQTKKGDSGITEMAAPKKPIGEQTTKALEAWVGQLGAQKAAEKLINKLSQTGMISDLPDSMEYGTGLNKVSALLEKKDYNNAYHTAKALATRLEKKAMKDMGMGGMFENNNNNKPQIKESMKRLKFKKEFNGVGNALKMIPESYKVDAKEFEMTDGNETYRIRWEGTLSEGAAVVITANDKKMVNEDIQRMKALFGYKSQDTLGLVKGNARIDENKVFGDIWNKSKRLLGESEEIEGQTADKTAPFEEAGVKQAAEAKKHVEGSASTEKGTTAPKPKTGNWEDNVKGQAAEAKKHVEGSVSTEKGTKAPKAKEGEWEEIEGSAPEATEHMESGTSTNKATNKAKVVKENTGKDDKNDVPPPPKNWKDNLVVQEGEDDEDGEDEEDDYNKPEDDDSSLDAEPSPNDITPEVPELGADDEEDAVKVPMPKAGGASLAFSPSLQAYWIKGPGLPLAGMQVPAELASIAADKSKKGSERANIIIARLQDMDDTDMGGEEDLDDLNEGLFGRGDEKKNAKAQEFDQVNAKLVGTKGDQTRNKEKWLERAKAQDNYNGAFIIDRGVLQYNSKSSNPLQGATGGSSGMGTANESKK